MRRFALLALAAALAVSAWAAKKKKEDETQTLQLPKELPQAVVGDAARLVFHVTPLSGRGLLSAQIRDALKALGRQSGNAAVLHIRAFVAGAGDLRRVRDIVSETYADRKLPLPSLSLVQAGALPLEGAQVVLEGVTVAKKDVNPNGLAWISGIPATSPDPLSPVEPLTRKSLEGLRGALQEVGANASDVLRVTCFFSSLDKIAESRKLVAAEYGQAALNLVQSQRAPYQAMAACEAVARLPRAPGAALQVRGTAEPGQSAAALVGPNRVVLTGTQVSFGFQDSDARLAFERLRKSLDQAGGGTPAFVGYYPLSPSLAAQVRRVRAQFQDARRPPAGSLAIFESLTARDAAFAIDMVAVKE